MQAYLFIAFFVCLVNVANGQQKSYLYFGESKIELKLDTLKSNEHNKVYNLATKQIYKMSFTGIPANEFTVISFENGDSVPVIDYQLDYNCSFIDTVQRINKIDLYLKIGSSTIKDVRYQYQLLSEEKRISTTFTYDLLKKNKAKREIQHLLRNYNKSSVILSAISFYNQDVLYILNLGNLCMFQLN